MRVDRAGWMACCALVGVGLSAQQTYRERVDVRRVLMDVRVVTSDGKPITGLVASDFAVRIDGKPASIDTLEWVAGERGTAESPHPSQPLAPSPAPGRWIVFLVQRKPDLSEIEGLMRLRKDLGMFADMVATGDRVAVLSFDTRLHVWLDFTSDASHIRRVMGHDILVEPPPRVGPGHAPSLLSRLPAETAAITYSIEKSLRLLGEALDPFVGAKTIIVLGYGMGTWLPREREVRMAAEYPATYFALQKARVSVYCIDITKADYHPRQEGLRLVAEDTGGFYVQSHIFTMAIFDRLAGALAGHYVLLVAPPDERKGERSVDVKLVGRKGTVVAKRAYLAE